LQGVAIGEQRERNLKPWFVAAGILVVVILSPVAHLGLTTAAGYLNCASGDNPNVDEKSIGFYEPCEPWTSEVSGITGEELTFGWRVYYFLGQGQSIRRKHGHLALIDLIWARLKGEWPVLAGGQDRG
jgi:hypothetical protein